MAKGLLALLAPAKGEGGGDEKEEAAQDLLDAIADKDAKAVALAFAQLYELCAGEGYDDDEED